MSEAQPRVNTIVAERAANRCEYCRMHQSLQGATFHVEHVVPLSKGGTSTLDNLTWCCPSCNLHKASRTDGIDRDTGVMRTLFHPRADAWAEHFYWVGHQLTGRTPTGRATINILNVNTQRRQLIRQAEERFALFPP